MERLKRNPVGWGVALGAAVAFISLFLVWVEVSARPGASQRFRAISSVTGQTLLFAAILAALAGFGVYAASTPRWRIVSSLLALAMGLLLAAAGAWALLDPAGFTKYAADTNAFSSLTTSVAMTRTSSALSEAFATGALDASARIGAVLGLVGGALTALGALGSFSLRSGRAR